MSSKPQTGSMDTTDIARQNDNGPLVSVIMPAFNVAEFIEKAFETVLAQSHKNLEILVVDDGSSDETANIIRQFAQKDPRIKPHFHTQNKGVSEARNTAIRNAKGEWLAIVDPDDWLDPKRFERLLEIAEQTDADGVADNQYFVSSKTGDIFGQLMVDEGDPINEMSPADFLNNDLPEMPGYGLLKIMLKRSFVMRHGLSYRSEFPRGQDCVFYCDCLAKGARIFLTSEPYYYYRFQRLGSTTRDTIGVRTMVSIAEVQATIETFFDPSDPEISKALTYRRNLIEECLHYRRVIDPLKQRKFGRAFYELIGEPAYAYRFAKRLSGAAWRRLARANPPTLAAPPLIWCHELATGPLPAYAPMIA